ncbi:MAG: hypothetical protein M3O46_13575, partial [Myxococcota bacterium]|nr:hypothetical protein [Myxococcota bacterium]
MATSRSTTLDDISVGARKRHPTWGPRKLRAWLLGRDYECPSASTAAVVRFIIPCQSSKTMHAGEDFELGELEPAREEDVKREVQSIRTIFFELFVEALVPTIRGEKLIWMLETTPSGQRLYELDLVKPKPRGTAKGA